MLEKHTVEPLVEGGVLAVVDALLVPSAGVGHPSLRWTFLDRRSRCHLPKFCTTRRTKIAQARKKKNHVTKEPHVNGATATSHAHHLSGLEKKQFKSTLLHVRGDIKGGPLKGNQRRFMIQVEDGCPYTYIFLRTIISYTNIKSK